jgi:hypothetical protein
MKRWILIALVACGGPAKPPAVPGEGATTGGPASGVQPNAPACDAARGKIEQLYRTEAKDREPARLDELVADNTTMVMNDCRKAPDKVPACITAATTVKELEARCLVPLDDEGSEGDSVAR